jgi:hypothetical protein
MNRAGQLRLTVHINLIAFKNMNLEQCIETYHASFINRNIVYAKNNFREQGILFTVRSIAFLMLVAAKVALSYFVRRPESKVCLFVSWSPLHTRLAGKIGQAANVIEIKNNLQKQQLQLFKNVSFSKAFNYARKAMNAKLDRLRTGYDNIYFCIAFMLEIQMMHNLVRGSKHLFMAGQIDRYAVMLSSLGESENKYLSFVQHGVNNMFKGLHRLHVDEIYYLFEISIPFFSAFVLDADKTKYFPIPSVTPNFKPDDRYKNAIAFASQIVESDLQILDILVDHYRNGDILIYPHPTEKDWNLYKKYKKYNNVFITMDRISNLRYIISSGSTLGLEYDLIGVPPVFINLNNIESEIFLTEKFLTFKDISSFRNWFLHNVTN